jgi:hypothetical protein
MAAPQHERAYPRTAAALTSLAIACAFGTWYLLDQDAFIWTVAPSFLTLTLAVAAVATYRRWFGVLFGWAYPAAFTLGICGTITAMEIGRELAHYGALALPGGCLDGVIAAMVFLGMTLLSAAGALAGVLTARYSGITIGDRPERAHAMALFVLVSAVAVATAFCTTPASPSAPCIL